MLTLYTVFTILVSIQIFFFNDTATTEIYTLSLHDALPVSESVEAQAAREPTREVVGLELEPQSRGDEMMVETSVAEVGDAFAELIQGARAAAKRHGHFHAFTKVESLEPRLRRELRVSAA